MTEEEVLERPQAKTRAKRRYLFVRDRVMADYPEIFDYAKPKPLAIGIHRKLIEVYDGQIGAGMIRRFLHRWTSRHEYQRELKDAICRFDLDGNETVRLPDWRVAQLVKQSACQS